MILKATVLGYYGFGNTGDEAVLEGMLKALYSAAALKGIELETTVLSKDPAKTKKRIGTDTADRMRLKEIAAALNKTDLFILGGGSLFQDVTGRGLSVLYYAGVTLIAKLLGKKIILYAQGVGPVKRKYNKILTQLAANAADIISVRDNGSALELRRIGISKKMIHITVDPAFALDLPKDSAQEMNLISLLPEKPIIGVMLRNWPGIDEQKNALARSIDQLVNRLSAKVALVPMHFPNDLKICQSFAALLKSESIIIETPVDPPLIAALFEKFDIVIAMRLHALIFAAIAGVPMVGIGYDPKVDAFLSQLEMPAAISLDNLNTDALTQQALRLLDDRKAIKEKLAIKADKMRTKAYGFAETVIDSLTKEK